MKLLAFEFDGLNVKTAIIEKKKKFVDILSLNTKDVKQFYIQKKFQNYKSVTSIGPENLIIKKTKLPLLKNGALKKALISQVKTVTALNFNEVQAIPILKKNTNFFDVTYQITSKKILSSLISNLKKNNLDPDIISSHASALSRFAKSLIKNLSNLFLIHIGDSYTLCLWIKDEIAVNSHIILIGKDHLTGTIDKNTRLEEVDFSFLQKYPHFQAKFSSLVEEIKATYFSFSENEKTEITDLLLTGNTEFSKNFEQKLFEHINIDSLKFIFTNSSEELRLKPYAVSIGLALDALSKDRKQIQFRINEFLSKKALNKVKTLSLLFFLFSIFFVSSIGYLSYSRFQRQKNSFNHELDQLIEYENTITPLQIDKNLSLQKKIDAFSKAIKKQNRKFPYFFHAYKPSDVIDGFKELPIEIKSFEYELVKYPHLKTKNTPYLVKIHLEFTADRSRKILELLKNLSFVDQKKDLFFEEEKNNYKVSFYLNEA